MPIQTPTSKARGICIFNETEAGTKFDQWLELLQSLVTEITITTEDSIRFVHIPTYAHRKASRWFFAFLKTKGIVS